jgi:hypothetical protein
VFQKDVEHQPEQLGSALARDWVEHDHHGWGDLRAFGESVAVASEKFWVAASYGRFVSVW